MRHRNEVRSIFRASFQPKCLNRYLGGWRWGGGGGGGVFGFNESHLVSLVPICCLDSSRSSSVCMGRMFFSSSSRLEGRLLSLMARESFLSTFCAREPKPKHAVRADASDGEQIYL